MKFFDFFYFHYYKKQYLKSLCDFLATTLIYLGSILIIASFMAKGNITFASLASGLVIGAVGFLIKRYVLGFEFK